MWNRVSWAEVHLVPAGEEFLHLLALVSCWSDLQSPFTEWLGFCLGRDSGFASLQGCPISPSRKPVGLQECSTSKMQHIWRHSRCLPTTSELLGWERQCWGKPVKILSQLQLQNSQTSGLDESTSVAKYFSHFLTLASVYWSLAVTT